MDGQIDRRQILRYWQRAWQKQKHKIQVLQNSYICELKTGYLFLSFPFLILK